MKGVAESTLEVSSGSGCLEPVYERRWTMCQKSHKISPLKFKNLIEKSFLIFIMCVHGIYLPEFQGKGLRQGFLLLIISLASFLYIRFVSRSHCCAKIIVKQHAVALFLIAIMLRGTQKIVHELMIRSLNRFVVDFIRRRGGE